MRHPIKQEYRASMDGLRFSREAKDAMTERLIRQTTDTGRKQQHSSRRIFFVALAAALVLATLTGAAVFTRWSTTAQNRYNPSEDIKEQAEKSGLSVMLEETKGAENPDEVLSVTDQGITITAVQSIVDNYRAEITFRIEGFELPEDEWPHVWPTVTIDGDLHFYGSQSGSFFDGTTMKEGKRVYVSTGEPVILEQTGEYQSVVLDPVADDGSLEYTHSISFQETDGRYLGKEIAFSFDCIGFQSHQKAGMPVPQVEGNWELKWILTGSSDSITITPNAKIGDSNVILLDAEIGQKTIRARYQVDEYWEGWNELVTLPQAVYGVRMKDGSEHICGAGTAGFEDQENMIYFTEFDIFDAILDISQVESLMFHKGWEPDSEGKPTIQTFYYIPIS